MHDDIGWMPYCGAAPVPGELAARWNLDPVLLAVLALAAVCCWRMTASTTERRSLALATGLSVLLFVSPWCALTSALFSARSAHHLALTAAVAPLIAAALPASAGERAKPSMLLWLPLSAITLWVWHAPAVYEAALSSHLVYWLMQISLLGTATGFWLAIRRSPDTTAIAALLGYMVQMGLLGALLTFSPDAIYAPHAHTTQPWGFTPLEDQQLAGLLMWVIGGAVYLGIALARLQRLLAREAAVAA
jgi:putative membrane protein